MRTICNLIEFDGRPVYLVGREDVQLRELKEHLDDWRRRAGGSDGDEAYHWQEGDCVQHTPQIGEWARSIRGSEWYKGYSKMFRNRLEAMKVKAVAEVVEVTDCNLV